ncbi:MAG: hypothetical protein H6506_05130 [Calditrichaeota bacterium]|nr:hypothetical protein [Calditrichota bacterium]MCB9392019.1 hypothetical protein [Calditrichota bacterium]
MLDDVIGALIGLVVVSGILLLVLIVVIMDNRTRRMRVKLLHEERMLALDKGLPVPMDYQDGVRQKRRPYVRGLVFLGIGIALLAWSGMAAGDEDLAGMAMVPTMIGLALIAGDWLNERRNAPKAQVERGDYASEPVKYP